MACALTSGYTFDCKDNIGGLKSVWFIGYNDVASVTEASGVITAITKDAGKVFYKYQLVRNTASFTENIAGSIENGTVVFNQELLIVINKMQTSMRNEMLLLAKNNMMAVVEDQNGRYWLAGRFNGLDLLTGSVSTGLAQADRNGYSFTFSGGEKESAPEVQSSVISTLTT
jgi:ligand-binding sensor domain-containing protein